MEKEEFFVFLAKTIKETRKKKGLTQAELGEKMGVQDSAIRRLESGEHNPTVGTLFDLANALGVDIFELLKSNFQNN